MTLLLHVLGRVAEGLCCSSVAWLKNKEHIDDKMTDMDTDRILCNKPQNRYVECSGLTVVTQAGAFPPTSLLYLGFYFEFYFVLMRRISTPGHHFASHTPFLIFKIVILI